MTNAELESLVDQLKDGTAIGTEDGKLVSYRSEYILARLLLEILKEVSH